MSCTAHIVYTFHISLHHANFGQFKAKQVLSINKYTIYKYYFVAHFFYFV